MGLCKDEIVAKAVAKKCKKEIHYLKFGLKMTKLRPSNESVACRVHLTLLVYNKVSI